MRSSGTVIPFSCIDPAPKDAIFSIDQACKKDKSLKKINLSVGAYRTDDGEPLVLECVRKAEAENHSLKLDKEYLPMGGLSSFAKLAQELIFSDSVDSSHVASIQSISGTGALRVAFEFLAKFGRTIVYLPSLTWANHIGIINAVGLEIREYRYFNRNTMTIDWEGMTEDLELAPSGSVVLFHMCAHNPTGQDPSKDQWRALLEIVKERELLPLFDAAYQGYASGDLDEDAYPVRLFAPEVCELMIAQSFSKNMGLYGERVGCLHLLADSSRAAQAASSHMAKVARTIYSNPPLNGARIAERVLSQPHLRDLWEQELKGMTDRLKKMRSLVVQALEAYCPSRDWSHIRNQTGMFAFTGLKKSECEELINHHHVYLLKNGRISLCGLNDTNVELFARNVGKSVESVKHGKAVEQS